MRFNPPRDSIVGGHRVKAIEHINQALAELLLALKADKD